jgi:hypothetical protein
LVKFFVLLNDFNETVAMVTFSILFFAIVIIGGIIIFNW